MRGKLQERKGIAGKSSLYIIYYPPVFNPVKNKYTRHEFLKLYTIDKPKNDFEKTQNKLNREIAEKILVKRLKSLMLEDHNLFNADILESSLFDFASKFILKKEQSGKDVTHYISMMKYLKIFGGDRLKFTAITEEFIAGFKEFLLTTNMLRRKTLKLETNSASSYFDKFLTLIDSAVQQKYLQRSPITPGSRIKTTETIRNYLTEEEIEKLKATRFKDDDLVRRASFFAILTGLRFGAIKSLQWKHLEYSKELESWYVQFIDPKPNRPIRHFIAHQAVELLGPRGEHDDPIFPEFRYDQIRSKLSEWLVMAGIRKKISFHCFRHTYATHLVSKGEDLYVISKMLNHKNIKTTQIYSKMPDKNKVAAANRMTI
jgi:integrase